MVERGSAIGSGKIYAMKTRADIGFSRLKMDPAKLVFRKASHATHDTLHSRVLRVLLSAMRCFVTQVRACQIDRFRRFTSTDPMCRIPLQVRTTSNCIKYVQFSELPTKHQQMRGLANGLVKPRISTRLEQRFWLLLGSVNCRHATSWGKRTYEKTC